jgi:hypothetical protein
LDIAGAYAEGLQFKAIKAAGLIRPAGAAGPSYACNRRIV